MTGVPPGWDLRSLEDVCQKVIKMDPKATGRRTIRYVDIGSVDGRRHRLMSVDAVPAATAPSRARQVLKAGDTVFSTVRPYLEKIAHIGDSLEGEFASTGFCVLRPGPEIDDRFLYHFAISRQMLDQVLPHQRGVSYPAVLDRVVKSAVVPLPPWDEQRRIVDILEDHLSRLDAAEASLANAAGRAGALRESWLQTHFHDVPAVELHRLGDSLTESRGGWSRSKGHLVDAPHGVPYLKMNNITREGTFNLGNVARLEASEEELKRYAIRVGDVLFNSKNSGDLIGKTTVATSEVAGWTFNENIMRLRFFSDLDPRFIGLWFMAPQMRTAIRRAASASTNVAAVYKHHLVGMPLWKPDRPTQLLLVEQFNTVASHVGTVRNAEMGVQRRSAMLRRALLAAAFSGRLTGRSSDLDRVEELVPT